jgi:hypothetical protein
MWKFERIYRELLVNSLNQVSLIPQEDISLKCRVSLGLVNKTIRKLEDAMAVEATRMGVRVLSPARLLNLWAAERNLNKDVWLSFRIDPVTQVEKNFPQDALITAFSAWSHLSGRKPAEYDRVHFYVTNKESFNSWLSFRKRIIRKTRPNVFALYVDDDHLIHSAKEGIVCVPQIYVDIYSIDGPEAAPFLQDIAKTHASLSLW